MSLEESILKLASALEANTAAILGGATAGAKAAPAPAEKEKPKAADKPKAPAYVAEHSHEEMAAALGEVKEKFGAPAAKAIIKETGGKDKMAEITDAKTIDAVYEAAKAKLTAEEDGM